MHYATYCRYKVHQASRSLPFPLVLCSASLADSVYVAAIFIYSGAFAGMPYATIAHLLSRVRHLNASGPRRSKHLRQSPHSAGLFFSAGSALWRSISRALCACVRHWARFCSCSQTSPSRGTAKRTHRPPSVSSSFPCIMRRSSASRSRSPTHCYFHRIRTRTVALITKSIKHSYIHVQS